MAAVYIAGILGAVLIIALIIMAVADRAKKRKVLTKEDAKLYRQAAQILNRLVHVTDLEGDFAKDIVSPETRAQITTWLALYRKELDK